MRENVNVMRWQENSCQFALGKKNLRCIFGYAGFSGGKAETQTSDLSEACGSLQDDKVTGFRQVMKR